MISVYKIEDKIPLCYILFVKMLSISVADTFVTRVGLLINVKKLYSYNVSTNSQVGLCIFEFNKFIL